MAAVAKSAPNRAEHQKKLAILKAAMARDSLSNSAKGMFAAALFLVRDENEGANPEELRECFALLAQLFKSVLLDPDLEEVLEPEEPEE